MTIYRDRSSDFINKTSPSVLRITTEIDDMMVRPCYLVLRVHMLERHLSRDEEINCFAMKKLMSRDALLFWEHYWVGRIVPKGRRMRGRPGDRLTKIMHS